MRDRWIARKLLLTCLLASGCASAPRPKPVAVAASAPEPPRVRVEKVREPLEVAPLELHFSGLRGVASASESVSVKNTGNEDDQLSDLRIVGTGAAMFKIARAPQLPIVLRPGASFSFEVAFAPGAQVEPGVHRARVRLIRNEDDDGPPCDLTGLVSRGTEPADEPSLQQVLDALGYEVDVGPRGVPVGQTLVGDEIHAPLFQRAKPGNVGYYLIARYTADEDSIFGYYLPKERRSALHGIGNACKTYRQTLNPELEGESQTSFDPGEAAFGLYLKSGRHTLYSDGSRNPAARKRAARVFPLRSRGRTPVQDAYVVAFDEDGDGDYQDHVFMLWNAKPAEKP
jgi:hypothetical protein